MHITDRPAIRSEEHPSSRVRRPQRVDGHEHHQQGEEGNQVARTANQLRSGKNNSKKFSWTLAFNLILFYSVIERLSCLRVGVWGSNLGILQDRITRSKVFFTKIFLWNSILWPDAILMLTLISSVNMLVFFFPFSILLSSLFCWSSREKETYGRRKKTRGKVLVCFVYVRLGYPTIYLNIYQISLKTIFSTKH